MGDMKVALGDGLNRVTEIGSEMLQGQGLLAIAVDRSAERFSIIGIQGQVVTCAADRNVELLAVDEFRGAVGVDVYDDAIYSGSLARMGG